MTENIKPTLGRVLVELLTEKKTEGGLFIPENVTKWFTSYAVIKQVGPECKFAQIGQKIIMNTHTGIEIKEGSDIKILNENDILAIVVYFF